jgi:predicted short-subunit dehydrogenase-like oxidoreductase (DUF2520 family)
LAFLFKPLLFVTCAAIIDDLRRKTTQLLPSLAHAKVRNSMVSRSTNMAAIRKRSRKKSRAESLTRRKTKGLRTSIIGAGRLGTPLARALGRAGHRIDVVVTAQTATARRAVKVIDSRSLAATFTELQDKDSEVYRRLSASELIIIATPDAVIEPVANELAAVFGKDAAASTRKARTVLHTSGAISSQVLNRLRLVGFATGSFHPLVSVADQKAVPKIFRDIHFCVEGDVRAIRVARMLVGQVGGRSFTIDSKSKPLYHAAAVMTAGHVVALFDLAVSMLGKCGLSPREAQRVLLPLLRSTTENLEKNGPARALTGPYARGDFETARKHLIALQESELDDGNKVYKILARHSLDLGKTPKRDPKFERDPNFEQLVRLLGTSS